MQTRQTRWKRVNVNVVIGGLTVLCLMSVVRGQTPTAAPVGTRFASVQMDFEKDVSAIPKIKDVNAYPSANVNAALQRTKKATLAPIPLKDKPLRGYVERSFPQPVDETNDSVPKEEVEKRFSLIRELLAKLSHLDSFRLDLTVSSTPAKARFELVPHSGTRMTSTTNSRLTNVYRGEYNYYVTKAGYKQIHETINFIDRAGTTLECELQPEGGAEDPLPCNFR